MVPYSNYVCTTILFLHSLSSHFTTTHTLFYFNTKLERATLTHTATFEKLRTRVVVVRELLFLVTSVFVCRSEVAGQRLRQLLTTFVQIFVYSCVLKEVDSQYYFLGILYSLAPPALVEQYTELLLA